LRRAFAKTLHCLRPLMGCQRRRAAELHAARLGTSTALAWAGGDEIALELRQPTERSLSMNEKSSDPMIGGASIEGRALSAYGWGMTDRLVVLLSILAFVLGLAVVLWIVVEVFR
jgi:hypothetical protein